MRQQRETTAYIRKWKQRRGIVPAAVLLIGFLLLLSVSLCGCGADSSSDAALQRTQSSDAEGRELYYLSQDQMSLSSLPYMPSDGQQVSSMGPEAQAKDVLAQLADDSHGADDLPPVRNFTVEDVSLSGSALTVSLSKEYASLDSTLEVLTRAAMVLSLGQIDGVESVSFLCGGESLKDAEGKDLGPQTPDLFINNSGKEITDYTRIQLHLFFADKEGAQLVNAYRNVVYNSNVPMERLVAEQVLKGPNSDTLYPTLNPAAKILSVTTRDNVCYLNFDQAFLTEPYNVTADVAIYSLVNSLTQLSSVQQVQITIDGDSTRSFMEVSLSAPFQQNLSVVEGESAE